MTKSAIEKAKLLKMIAADIIKDGVGAGLAKTATQLVPGEGDANSKVVFVGEAPGRFEDEQGRPFVGAAGKLLNQLLEGIGLARSAVFITNIVKYRPPANRDPKPEEIAAFLPYLKRQLAVIQPALVIPLGRHALNALLPGQSISVCHGQPKRLNGQVYLPLYHPAVALYNQSMRKVLEADFAKIPAILKLVQAK